MEKIIDGLYKLMGVQGTSLMAEALLPYFGIFPNSTHVYEPTRSFLILNFQIGKIPGIAGYGSYFVFRRALCHT